MNATVYKNASVVTGLTVAERALGFLYRVVLSRLLGAEGLGLYQIALSFFSLCLTVGAGGLPVTLSRLSAKSRAENRLQDENAATAAALLLALLGTFPVVLAFYCFGNRLAGTLSDARALPVLRILLLGECAAACCAVLRGRFWGEKEFFLPSALELAEEIVMVLVGTVLLQTASDPVSGAKTAAWAHTISVFVGCAVAVAAFIWRNGKLAAPKPQLKPLIKAAAPVVAVRSCGALVGSAVAVLLPLALMRTGMESRAATELFGVVSGMVLPLLCMPSTLIGSLALVLVPELSEAHSRRREAQLAKDVERGLQFAFLVACALLPVFFTLGETFGRLAFSNEAAGKLIVRGAWLLLPMSLTVISSSMLNSMGYEKQTFLFFLFGTATLLLSVLLLPRVCGVYAYLLGFGCSHAVNAVCSLALLRRRCPRVRFRLKESFLALCAAFALALLGRAAFRLFSRITGAYCAAFGMLLLLVCAELALLFCAKKLPLPTKNARQSRRRKKSLPF